MGSVIHLPSTPLNHWHIEGKILQLKVLDKVIKQLSCKRIEQNHKKSLSEWIGITSRVTLNIGGEEKTVRVWSRSLRNLTGAKKTNTNAQEAIQHQSAFMQKNGITFVQIQSLLSLSQKELEQVFEKALDLPSPINHNQETTPLPIFFYKKRGKTLSIKKNEKENIFFTINNHLGIDITDAEIAKLLKLDEWNTSTNKQEAIKKIITCFRTQSEKLDLSDLDLSTLPPNLFEHLPWLKMLNLSRNHLDSLTLSSLPLLEDLNLSHNFLSRFEANSALIPKLKKLNLFNNLIQKDIDRSLFPNLKTLNLACNLTETVHRRNSLQVSKYLSSLPLKTLDELFPPSLEDNELQRNFLQNEILNMGKPIFEKLTNKKTLTNEEKMILSYLRKIAIKASLL